MKTHNLTIFCDERKKNDDSNWIYLCALIIPTVLLDDIYEESQKIRERLNYFHSLKFTAIKPTSNEKHELAVEWIRLLFGKYSEHIKLKVLGINLDNLNFRCFGNDNKPNKKYCEIYNRFFRTNIKGALHYFYTRNDIKIIDNIFHDSEGQLQNHPYFDFHITSKIKDKNIDIQDNISFVLSDHNKESKYPRMSEFIQMTDLLVGTVAHTYDALGDFNEKKYNLCHGIASLIENSEKYKRINEMICSVQFFPSCKLAYSEINDKLRGEKQSGFYKNRIRKIVNRKNPQLKLEF